MTRVFLDENNCEGFVESFEVDGHYIEIDLTIFKGYRVKIREVGSQYYMSNWCAGKDLYHKDILLKVAEYCIINDIKYPAYNDPKPFYNDVEFIAWMNSIGFEI